MKNTFNRLKRLSTALLIVSLGLFTFTLAAHVAQDKPAGKPWPAPDKAIKMKNPVKPEASSISEGKDLYSQHCKSCHGAKGKGDGPKSGKIDISCGDFTSADFAKKTDGELFWKTVEGRKPMPSFKEKLSDNEVWNIVNYIRTLK